ncbi:efflux RND transporter permease subunit [Algibacter sp. PT7-4]|uniref:efflux RND transporter permease subunit n=1 Tax=Algibacter ulvanivorans TaxID=3400999 RepID=UPI003AAD82B6
MLNKSVKYLIDNKQVIVFVIFFLTIFGILTSPFSSKNALLSNYKLSVDAIPDLGENQQIVITEWGGQSPEDIEDQITFPLTSNLLGIPGVKSVRSNSMLGVSMIYIIFQDDIDFYWSRSRIVEKLNAIPYNLLPKGVQPKLGPNATALGQVFWYTLEGRDPNGEVTGGWNLEELRTIQDFYVKNSLNAILGVSEVTSIGGFVKEYQIDVDPELMHQWGVTLEQVVVAIKNNNRDVGAQTIEINKAEYFVRGLGYIKSIKDIENASILSNDFTPIRIKDVAKVIMGPAPRRGVLDKGGAEVVGGVVTVANGENPMDVTNSIKEKIKKISIGLPEKMLSDGTISKLEIIPFYDRSKLIKATLNTLSTALWLEVLITIIVVVIMLRNLKVAFLISGLLPLTILTVFIIMKLFSIEANIVALSGIAIAIGTIVDMGIILSENIIRYQQKHPKMSIKSIVINATKEVSGAIIAAGLTTIISFIPVFTLTGVEGKLFIPLAFTKTVALFSAVLITLFIIPPLASVVLKKNIRSKKFISEICVSILGVIALFLGFWVGGLFLFFGLLAIALYKKQINTYQYKIMTLGNVILMVALLLAMHWRPLGFSISWFGNLLFVVFLLILILLPFYVFIRYYHKILSWVLEHKKISISIPLLAVFFGFFIFLNSGEEFMPRLEEGDFLLMPTSLPHAGVSENIEILKKLDVAVATLPEIEYVVGKAGRTSSALDPAPMSMFENLISYKSEYILDEDNNPIKFKVNEKGEFETKSGIAVLPGSGIKTRELIVDESGEYFRNWRNHIKNEDDIWKEITKVTQLPGVTSAPKLQPIETRLVMLQTGMRSPLGIKIKGQNLKDVETFGLELERILKRTKGVKARSVFADRVTGKPYLLFDIDRDKIARYGLSVEKIQSIIEVAVGGKIISKTIENRESYGIRVRYPRELRNSPKDLEKIYIDLPNKTSVPISNFVTILYKKGPQSIKSEDGFLVSYVIFDKVDNLSEVSCVTKAKQEINKQIKAGNLEIPSGVNYEFSGTYQDHLHAQKTLSFIIPVCFLIILLVLYFQFKSITTSLIVFSGVLVAFAGGFILIWFYGQSWFMNFNFLSVNFRELFHIDTINLSVAVWVGFIALFGIATDDGVIMATYLKQAFEKQTNQNISEIRAIVIKAGKKRLRPCLMTTATTILALLPILTASGKGASIMLPMAIPCLGGMLMALITLFVVPLLFCWKKELSYNRLRTK